MLINNIKKRGPQKAYGNSLNFNDPLATEEEIIRFINEIPQEITRLQFSERSVVPSHFGKLKWLNRLQINFGSKTKLSDTILKFPVEQLDLRLCEQGDLSLSFFQNETINGMSIYGNYEYLPEGDYNLPNLEMLELQSEKLSRIPKGSHSLPNLKVLNISNCKVDCIPSSFLIGGKLEILSIFSTELQQLPLVLSRCRNLQNLTVYGPLKSGLPDLSQTSMAFILLQNLLGLDYSECALPVTIKRVIIKSNLSKIVHLPQLNNCSEIRELHIYGAKFFPKLPADLGCLLTMSAYRIDDEVLPQELSTAKKMKRFEIVDCPLKDVPHFLTDLTSLEVLTLKGITAFSFPDNWQKCQNLTGIIVHGNNLKIENLNFAKKLKKLVYLELIGAMVSDRYSLISKIKIPLALASTMLKACKFRTVSFNAGTRSKSLKSLDFTDFAAALGKTKLSEKDKKYFFDLLWKTPTVEDFPVLDFSAFLKALSINFRPLAQLLQRRLVREVLLQHFVRMKLVQNPIAFEATDEKFLLLPDSKPMLENLRVFLRNESADNVRLGLQMLKTGGVPAEMAEELLLLAKTDENADIRKEAEDLLLEVAPPDWSNLIKNQLQFYISRRNYTNDFFTNKLTELAERTTPKTAAFFALLLRRKYRQLLGSSTDIDEFLFSVAESLGIEDKLLEKGAVVFVNGTTTLKKGEIKDKLEAIGIKYATKYSDKVTHVLVGKNPSEFDIQRADVQILIENFLQKYLSQTAPDFLEQAEQEGDTAMSKSVLQFLESQDANSALVGLEMLKTGGVPESILPALLVMQKSYDNAKVRGAAKKLLERYGPAKWLPLLSSRLIFKSIGKGAKETDNYNRLIKLEKEISFETAAELSLLFYQKYQRGLRFLVKRGTKGGAFHMQAYQAMYREECLHLSSGVGYTDWRTRGNFDNYYGSTGMVSMSISFPKDINELGKIREIDLHNVKVKAMPKGITNLVDLQKIDASFNGLKSLPQGLKKLNKLEELDLSFNDFSDFPDWVVELMGLKKLDLRNQKNKQLKVPESVQKALPDCEILV